MKIKNHLIIFAISFFFAIFGAQAAPPAQGASICFDLATGLNLIYQLDFSDEAAERHFDVYVAAHYEGNWAFLNRDGKWSMFDPGKNASPPPVLNGLAHPIKGIQASNVIRQKISQTGLMSPTQLPGLQFIAGYGVTGSNSFSDLLQRGRFGVIGSISGKEAISASCVRSDDDVIKELAGGSSGATDAGNPNTTAAPANSGAGGGAGAPAPPNAPVTLPPAPNTLPAADTGSPSLAAAVLKLGDYSAVNLGSVERLYKSAKYKVDLRKTGDASFVENFVFETRNDWVVYDFFNPDPALRTVVKRGANELGRGKSDIASLAFTRFSFANTAVDVRVSLPPGAEDISNVTIRPLRLGITAKISNDKRSLTFTLPQPRKISVEINDRLNPLFILADAPDEPLAPNRYTYYFGPGVHRLGGADGTLTLQSDQSVYIASGAIVEGRFVLAKMSNNISITGRGILSRGEWSHTSTSVDFLIKNSTFWTEGTGNFKLEGITVVNSNAWQVALGHHNLDGDASVSNKYLNVNLLSWNGNTDAFWVDGNHTIVDNAFVFNNDDLIVSKGGTGARVTNVVHWGGVWGRSLLIHPIINRKPNVEDMQLSNIDVIGKEGSPTLFHFEQDEQSIARAPSGITLRNFRVEERRRPGNSNNNSYNAVRFLTLKDDKNRGSYMTKLLFENVTLDQALPDEGFIQGTGAKPFIGVEFKNFRRGGIAVTDPSKSGISFDSITDLKFR